MGDHPIGCGGFADVWKGSMSEGDDDCGGIAGVWAGSTTDEDVGYPSQQVVALKVLKQFNTDGTQRADLLKVSHELPYLRAAYALVNNNIT